MTPYYHGIFKKIVTVFGTLFSNLSIERKLGDSVTGSTAQTLTIPIAYGNREKWLVKIEKDPKLTDEVHMKLPAMSYEITSYYYNNEMQLNKNNGIRCTDENGIITVRNPVPYIIDINLHILGKTNEDVFQIVEQIIPMFSPDLDVTIKVLPALNITDKLNITLFNTNLNDNNDGSFQGNRLIVHTLSFQIRTNFYSAVNSQSVIEKVIVNLTNDNKPFSQFTAEGDIDTGEINIIGWDDE